MRSLVDLRTKLATLYSKIESKEIEIDQAKEMNNSAGKILNSLKVELKYYELAKEVPNIPFIRGK